MQTVLAKMASLGPEVRTDLENSVAPSAVKSGHIVDALMTLSATMSQQIERGETEGAFKSMIGVLWLSRALAHSEGKLQEKAAASA